MYIMYVCSSFKAIPSVSILYQFTASGLLGFCFLLEVILVFVMVFFQCPSCASHCNLVFFENDCFHFGSVLDVLILFVFSLSTYLWLLLTLCTASSHVLLNTFLSVLLHRVFAVSWVGSVGSFLHIFLYCT